MTFAMSKGRLTRQELGWLLTQEASGAAERLRVGVQVLKTNAPPPLEEAESNLGLDDTLNALDDAMKMLSSLHQKPSGVRGRRGRIDVAALIWEVAPDARVSIEPGSGTEVFGEEGELRRMLHVFVGHGTGAGSAITIKREGDEVRVSVVLGPDSSANAETERAWLSRMAVRYGGRYDLEAGAEVLSLPADGVSERNEREALRKELDEARKQGEAYARELAQVYTHEGVSTASPSTIPPPMQKLPTDERFLLLSKFAGGIAAELRSILSPAARAIPAARHPGNPPTALPENVEERWDTVRRALSRAQDFVGALAHLGELDPDEGSAEVDLVEATRHAVQALAGRAERMGVSLQVREEGVAIGRTAPRAVAVLLRELISQAIAASPRGAEVVVTVEPPRLEMGPRVTVDDAGAPIPASARRAFVGLGIEPGTHGRPTSVPLYVANEIATWRGSAFELSDAPAGGLRAIVTFTRAL